MKLPCTAEGIRAVKYFSQKGIRTNCTLVFSPGQALLAAKAGATYVSPFVGRLDDICADGVELVRRIVEIYRYYGYATQVLAASIRHTQHIDGSHLVLHYRSDSRRKNRKPHQYRNLYHVLQSR